MDSKRPVTFIFLLVAISLIGLVVYYERWSPKTNEAKEPITFYIGILVEEMDLDDLIRDSERIVIGTVDVVYPGRWSTPNGESPSYATAMDFIIISDVNFHIAQTLKGNVDEVDIRIREFGGQAGQDSVIISASENYDLSQKYLLFLIEDTGPTADIEPGHFIATGGAQGVYKIKEDRATPFHGSVDQSWKLDELIKYIESTIK